MCPLCSSPAEMIEEELIVRVKCDPCEGWYTASHSALEQWAELKGAARAVAPSVPHEPTPPLRRATRPGLRGVGVDAAGGVGSPGRIRWGAS
jgi:hypothetical protein